MKSEASICCSLLSFLLLLPVGLNAAEVGYDDLIQQSLQARNIGEFQRAETLLRRARPLARETNEVDLLLGMNQAFQERFIEAMATINGALEEYPDDVGLRLGRARVLSYQGVYDESLADTEIILSADPSNVEARNLQARIYFYQRRFDLAAASFQQILEQNPNDLETLIGLHDVEMGRNNTSAANEWLLQAEEVAPGHIDVVSRQQGLATPILRHHILTVGAGRSRFDLAGFSRWYDRFTEYRYLRDNGDQLIVFAEHDHRFGLHDGMTELGYRFERQGQLPIEIAVAWNEDSEFLIKRRIRLGTDFLLQGASDNFGATTLEVSASQSRYNTGDVSQLRFNFTHYLLNTDVWITPGIGVVKDENDQTDMSWTIGTHWQASSRVLVGYNYTNAPETENNVTVLTRTHHIYGSYSLNDSLSLRVDAALGDRQNSYERGNLAVSLQYRF